MRTEVLSISVVPVSRAGHGAWDQASHHLCKGPTGPWQDGHGQLTSTKDMATDCGKAVCLDRAAVLGEGILPAQSGLQLVLG